MPAPTNTITPTAPNQNGTYGRFRYVPSKNVFIVVNSVDENVYFYKFTSSLDDSLAVTGLNVYASDTSFTEFTRVRLAVVATREDRSRDTVTHSCSYVSLDPYIAETAGYEVTGIAPGIARIQVTKSTAKGTVSDTIVLTILDGNVTADSMVVSLDKMFILTGNDFSFQATAYFHVGNKIYKRDMTGSATWISADPSVFTVTNGLVQGVSAGGPAGLLVESGGQRDTAEITVYDELPVPSFIKKINFQVSANSFKTGWLPDNGGAYTAQKGYGWADTNGTALLTRDNRNGDYFLLKSFVLTAAPAAYRIDAPDGEYIVKTGMGDNAWADKGYQWVEHQGDTLISHGGAAVNIIRTDTITVSGGNGILLGEKGAINYLVVISSEGIDIDYVANDGLLPSAVEAPDHAGRAARNLLVFPNPFNPSCRVSFKLPQDTRVRLEVFSTNGRLIRSLRTGALKAGDHTAVWDSLDRQGRPAPAGLYLFRLSGSGKALITRAVLVK
jgi:hypothetical protein